MIARHLWGETGGNHATRTSKFRGAVSYPGGPVRLSFFLALVSSVVLSTGCGSDGAPSSGTGPSATSTAANDGSQPVIDDRFAVGPHGPRLAMRCFGKGSPPIILEAGHPASGIDQFSGLFYEPLAQRTMTCLYDRLGQGRSDPAPNRRRTLADLANDLHALLSEAKVAPPYLLVGTSFGGFVIVEYAGRYKDEVAGLVFLEVPAPSARLTARDAPEAAWDHSANPERVDALAAEHQLATELPTIRPVPIRIVTATAGQSSKEHQAYWRKLSPEASQVVIVGGHGIYYDNPSEASREVLKTLDAIED
jgi:alpha/beta hydrolase fold